MSANASRHMLSRFQLSQIIREVSRKIYYRRFREVIGSTITLRNWDTIQSDILASPAIGQKFPGINYQQQQKQQQQQQQQQQEYLRTVDRNAEHDPSQQQQRLALPEQQQQQQQQQEESKQKHGLLARTLSKWGLVPWITEQLLKEAEQETIYRLETPTHLLQAMAAFHGVLALQFRIPVPITELVTDKKDIDKLIKELTGDGERPKRPLELEKILMQEEAKGQALLKSLNIFIDPGILDYTYLDNPLEDEQLYEGLEYYAMMSDEDLLKPPKREKGEVQTLFGDAVDTLPKTLQEFLRRKMKKNQQLMQSSLEGDSAVLSFMKRDVLRNHTYVMLILHEMKESSMLISTCYSVFDRVPRWMYFPRKFRVADACITNTSWAWKPRIDAIRAPIMEAEGNTRNSW